MKELQIDSSCYHGDGNLSAIARWLLDRLDDQPPPPGGVLMLYLCRHPDDHCYFNRPTTNAELAAALWDEYQRECGLDPVLFGELHLTLEKPSTDHQPLHLRRKVPNSTLSRDTTQNTAPPATRLEFSWYETTVQIAPGILNLVRRWYIPLEPKSTLVATLTVYAGATLMSHLRGWQGHIRWTRPIVYLPEGETVLLIGPIVGCDLYAPALRHLLVVSYDSDTDLWRWSSQSATKLPMGQARGEFDLQHPGPDGKPMLVLKGKRLSPPRTWEKQEKMNRLPMYSIVLLGCVLPLPSPDGYGWLPPMSPVQFSINSKSALRLPTGDWLYLNARTNKPHVYRPSAQVADQQLIPNEPVTLSAPSDGGWKPHGLLLDKERARKLPPFFHSELQLQPPLVQPLACGALAEDLPDEMFPQHMDSTLTPGRPPVQLKSTDGCTFMLVFNRSARLPVFVLNSDSTQAHQYNPTPEKVIELEPGAEFIIGTTHYSLQPVKDQPD